MNCKHDRQGVRRILTAVALPLLILLLLALILPTGAAARPPAVAVDLGGGSGTAPGAIQDGLSGSSGDPIGGERLPPRILDPPPVVALYDPGAGADGASANGSGAEVSGGLTGLTLAWGWAFMPPVLGLSFLLLRLGAMRLGGPTGSQ